MFLLIGGLGDSQFSLSPWEFALTTRGQESRYVKVHVTGSTGFAHRVETLCAAIQETNGPIYLIGQSAGGLAALIASTWYPEKVRGVIAVSPAMPRGISPLGWPLLKVMWRYEWAMLRHELITVNTEDYASIALNGVKDTHIPALVAHQQKISGREALELSTPWLQPKLPDITVPTILIWGDDDHWIRPHAYWELFKRISSKESVRVYREYVSGAGHLPAHSEKGRLMVERIINHITS